MFSYLVKNAETELGIDLSGRIHAKTDGYWWITNLKEEFAKDFVPIPQIVEGFTVVFSEQDIPDTELLHWTWNGLEFMKLSEGAIQAWETAAEAHRAELADRQNGIQAMKASLVEKPFDALSVGEKKLLVGLTPTDEEIQDFRGAK
jgi:hypothetical protein